MTATKQADTEKILNLIAAMTVKTAKKTNINHDSSGPSVWDLFQEQISSPLQGYLSVFDNDLLSIARSVEGFSLSDQGRVLVGEFLDEVSAAKGDDSLGLADYIVQQILKDEERLAHCLNMCQGLEGDFIEWKLRQKLHLREEEEPAAPQLAITPELGQEHKECATLWNAMASNLKAKDCSLPPFVEQGLMLAQRQEDRQKIVEILSDLKTASAAGRGNTKLAVVGALLTQLDPSLVLPFARKPVFSNVKDGRSLMSKVDAKLKELCPNREDQIEEILLTIARRLHHDDDALYPLLYGPPGTGKTFLVEILAEVFAECGLPVTSVIQSMSQNGGYSRENNEVAMSLQGTSAKWGDAQYGLLLKSCLKQQTSLCLTVLDEVDKCGLQNYLVSLLDPRQPLQDSFLREFLPSIDMRHKCLFFLTANDTRALSDGANSALWTRLSPIELPEYSRDEAKKLVVKLVERRMSGMSSKPKDLRLIAEEVFASYSGELPSIRTLIDGVKKRLYQKQYPFLKGVPGQVMAPIKKVIGFQASVSQESVL